MSSDDNIDFPNLANLIKALDGKKDALELLSAMNGSQPTILQNLKETTDSWSSPDEEKPNEN